MKRDDVDLVFPETQRGLNRFDQTGAVWFRYRNPVLNDLDTRTEAFDLFVGIDAHDFGVDPDAEITLLLDEIEEGAWFRLVWDRHPTSDQNILPGQYLEKIIGDG